MRAGVPCVLTCSKQELINIQEAASETIDVHDFEEVEGSDHVENVNEFPEH